MENANKNDNDAGNISENDTGNYSDAAGNYSENDVGNYLDSAGNYSDAGNNSDVDAGNNSDADSENNSDDDAGNINVAARNNNSAENNDEKERRDFDDLCHLCDAEFGNKKDLKDHMKVHQKVAKFKCPKYFRLWITKEERNEHRDKYCN